MPQLRAIIDHVLRCGFRPWHLQRGTHYRAAADDMGTAGETPNVSIEDALDEVANAIKLDMEQFRASDKE